MVAVPAATPIQVPVAEPIVATAVLLLLHVPPPVASVKVPGTPEQMAVSPDIAATGELTVTVVVYTSHVGVQPERPPLLTVNEYVLVTVTVSAGFCIEEVKPPGPDHTKALAPPPGFAVNVTDPPPLQTGPLLVGAATGVGFTVTTVVYIDDAQPVVLLDTVKE